MTSPDTAPEYMVLFHTHGWDQHLSPQDMQAIMNRTMAWFEELQQAGNDARDAAPVLSLARELPAAALRDRVEPRAPVVLGHAPLGGDPSLLLQAKQRGVHGSLVQPEHRLAQLLDTRIPALLGDLDRSGVRFKDLKTSQSSLEDIFVTLLKGTV